VSVCGLQAEWNVGKGPDRHFQVDSFAQAEKLQPKLIYYQPQGSAADLVGLVLLEHGPRGLI
jgi:hypothetical protein